MTEEYIKKLNKLLKIERDFEKEKNTKLIIESITNNSPLTDKTLDNIVSTSFKGSVDGVKLKIPKNSKVNINIEDRILISDKENLAKNSEAIVCKKNKNSIIAKLIKNNFPKYKIPKLTRVDLLVKDSEYYKMSDNLEESNKVRETICFIVDELTPKNKKIDKINFFDETLNKNQQKAVLRSMAAEDFFLIHGPFGTGKTKTLIELIRQENKKNSKILVTADSNAAVDNIVERLMEFNLKITRIGNYQEVKKEVKDTTLKNKIKNHDQYYKIEEIYEIINDTNLELSHDDVNNYYNEIKKNLDIIKKDIIYNSDIILTTNSSAALNEISEVKFDVLIVDEASQATIPKILIPIAKAKKFILAGDHKQLPPTVMSEDAKELEKTLFEKLINKYPNQSLLLNIQYRMNKTLMDFPNKMFYNNELKCSDDVKNIKLDYVVNDYDIDFPLLFINTSRSNEKDNKFNTSYYNNLEAKLAINFIKDYINLGINEKDIGIITHYSRQKSLIKDILESNGLNIKVSTVDGFQGSEKDIIIISNVRSNDEKDIGFLNDKRRLNVALTRARKKLIIIGDVETLKRNEIYKKLIKYCDDKLIIQKY